MTTLLIIIVILALVFDFINGFHDAANSIATVVSTKVLTPFQAVLWAALFNFLAFFIFKDHGVANTVAKTVKAEFVTLPVVISGLLAAIIWNLLTWWYGIPSSSSHTLIGGFAGAGIAAAGFGAVDAGPVIKVASFIFLAPMLGMLMAFIISVWFLNSFRKGPFMKLISVAIIAGTGWFVWASLDMKKDFTGGNYISIAFDEKVKKDDLKKKLTFKDDKGKEHSPVIKSGTDSLGRPDKTGRIWVLRTNFMKKADASPVSEELLGRIRDSLSSLNAGGEISGFHRIQKISPETERFDTSHLKASFESYWLKVIFHGANFKWILLGFIIITMAVFTLWLSNLNLARSSQWFKRLQLVSSAAFSIGHGGNDAQKVMGIITAALIAGGAINSFDEMPGWVPLACYTAIGLGTMSGGWRIVKTMGTRITKVTPFEGVAAETAGALTLFGAENFKIPVSTTHTITGSIMGVGATKRLSAVRWGVTLNLLWAWILTIPVTGLLAAIIYYISRLFV